MPSIFGELPPIRYGVVNEPTLVMNTNVAAMMTSLMESGRIMEVKVLNLPAPTSRAPSMMESGIAPKPAVIIIAANGMLNQRFIVMIPLA